MSNRPEGSSRQRDDLKSAGANTPLHVCQLVDLPLASSMAPLIWLAPEPSPANRDIAALVYGQFQFSPGTLSLAGLRQTPVLILVAIPNPSLHPQPSVGECVAVMEDGILVDPQQWNDMDLQHCIDQLLRYLQQPESQPAHVQPIPMDTNQKHSIALKCKQLLAGCPELTTAGPGCLLVATQLERISGKLQFQYEYQTVESSFEIWTRLLLRNPGRIKPYYCPLTETAGYQLSIDDEGDISLSSSIETCEVTGSRLMKSKLATCAVTGKRAARSLLRRSTLQGTMMLPEAVRHCRMCGLGFTASQLKAGHCEGCRNVLTTGTPSAADLLWLQHTRHQWDQHPREGQGGQATVTGCYRQEGLIWVLSQESGRKQLCVLDSQGQLVVRRRQRLWRRRWEDL